MKTLSLINNNKLPLLLKLFKQNHKQTILPRTLTTNFTHSNNNNIPEYEIRARKGFQQQPLMKTIGATLTKLEKGLCEIELPFQTSLTQQNGFLHAGIATTLMDNSAGIAALSTMKPGHGVLTISFTVNLLSPALGEKFIAKGIVMRAGNTITTCKSDLFAIQKDGKEKQVATMLASMMTIVPNIDSNNNNNSKL
jgi:uncharacterized protein (TIGR00369 family)